MALAPWAGGLSAALVLAAPAATLAGSISGTASYRERIALPPDAEFEVQIQDVARADAPATVIGRQLNVPAGQPPFRFNVAYDKGSLAPGGRYSLRATVRHRGRLLFTTDTMTPVALDGSDGPVELVLKAVGQASAQRPPQVAPLVAPLRGTTWQLQMLENEPVPAADPQGRPIELVLQAGEARLAGSDGCNRLIGGFTVEGERLQVSQLGSTQMACSPERMALGRRYTEALAKVRRWSVDRRSLLLQDASGRTLLLFRAAALSAGSSDPGR